MKYSCGAEPVISDNVPSCGGDGVVDEAYNEDGTVNVMVALERWRTEGKRQVGMESYGTYWKLLREYVGLKRAFPVELQRLSNQLLVSMMMNRNRMPLVNRVEVLARQDREGALICEDMHRFFNSDLVIEDSNGMEYRIAGTEIGKFLRGGVRDVIVTSFKMLRPELSDRQGGCDVDCVVYMSSGYPIHMSISGDYRNFEGDRFYLCEDVLMEGMDVFHAEDGYVEAFGEYFSHLIGIHLDMEAVKEVPQGLERGKVLTTILYHWFSVFMLGKKKMMDDFKENMKYLAGDSDYVYCPSHMKGPPPADVNMGVLGYDGTLNKHCVVYSIKEAFANEKRKEREEHEEEMEENESSPVNKKTKY